MLHVRLVDSAVETALEMRRVINSERLNGSGGNGEFSIILSDTSPVFEELGRRFLGREIPKVELVTV